MTVSSSSSRVVYAGNGSTTVFPFAFKVAQPADLVVVYTDAGGGDVTLSPFQYAASGFGADAGGTVTYPTVASGNPPIAAGTRLTIYRDVPLTQPTSISNQGAMWPQVIEAALDRLTWLAQQLQDQADRTFQVSESEQGTLDLLPSAEGRADSVLGFDGDGQPYAAVLDAGVVAWSTWVIDNWRPVASAAAARTVLDAPALSGSNAFTNSNDFTSGAIVVPTAAPGENSVTAASTAFVKTKAESTVGGAVLRAWLAGLGMANNAIVPNLRIDVAAGACADDTNAVMLVSAGELLDCASTGPDGLDSGSLANNTWYHAFLIGRADGAVASFASTSLAPSLPATFLYKRRIGSFRTDGSAHIRAFVQAGDLFQWVTPMVDVSATNPGTAAVSRTLSVPTGVAVQALVQQVTTNNGAGGNVTAYCSDLATADTAPSTTFTDVPYGAAAASNVQTAGTRLAVRTSTSAQIRSRLGYSDANVVLTLNTLGWIDRRGRDD